MFISQGKAGWTVWESGFQGFYLHNIQTSSLAHPARISNSYRGRFPTPYPPRGPKLKHAAISSSPSLQIYTALRLIKHRVNSTFLWACVMSKSKNIFCVFTDVCCPSVRRMVCCSSKRPEVTMSNSLQIVRMRQLSDWLLHGQDAKLSEFLDDRVLTGCCLSE